jgi:hypothetical protein
MQKDMLLKLKLILEVEVLDFLRKIILKEGSRLFLHLSKLEKLYLK